MYKLFIVLLLLTACSKADKTTIINVSPPDFIKNELTSACEKPEDASTWMQLVEHNHFKCTGGFSQGSRSCYGWYIEAYAKCKVKGVGLQTLKSEGAVSFGNTSLDPKEE